MNSNAGSDKKELTPVQLMDKAVQCLYIELPNSVANDVSQKWLDAKQYLSALHKPSQQPIPVNQDEGLWIKIGEHIGLFDRNKLSEDIFEVDTPYIRYEITNDNGRFFISNAVDGYGINRKKDFENTEVKFLEYTRQQLKSSPSPVQEGLKEMLVMKDYDGEFEVWSREHYNEYISDAVNHGAGSAYKIVSHFNRNDDLLFPKSEASQEGLREDDDAWWELFKDIDESKDYETNIVNLKKKYSITKL